MAGGDAATRDRIARLDLAELKARDAGATITKRVVAIRLQLAGYEPSDVVLTGAEHVVVTTARRAVTADEVLTVVKAELLKRSPAPDGTSVELAQPIAVRLPEVPSAEPVTVTAVPHGRTGVGPGRVQMDVSISAGSEKLLSFPVHVDVWSGPARAAATGPAPMNPLTPVSGAVPVLPPMTQEVGAVASQPSPLAGVLIKPRQRVKMVVRLGAVDVSAVGEAQQEGRIGQSITLQNVDSKKMVTGRVIGPGTVEVDLGGGP
jgi:hypothetical protein